MKKNIFLFFIALAALHITSCSKDDPTPEQDQEEVGTAKLIFTEVDGEAHGDHYHYHDIDNPEVEDIEFTPTNGQLLPPVGAHLHLEVGKSYRLELKSTDFAGRESQQTFVDRAEIHQAFILGAPANTIYYQYGDEDSAQVGVTGYITVLDHSETFVFEYIMRHLNPGVKETIKASDWSNANYLNFAGATDLHLKFDLHLVEGDDHGHDDDHDH